MREVSAIDAKILKDLLKDGRKNFTAIAKECGETKSTIWKHYIQMKKAGIITGATIQLNYASFGYDAVGIVQFKTEPRLVDHAVEYCKKMPNIHSAWRMGKSSIVIVVATLETLDELDRVKETIKKLPLVSELRTNVWTGIRNIPENLSIIPLKKKAYKVDTPSMEVTTSIRKTASKIVDETDIQIVEKLAKDGRVSFRKIAKDLNISTNTVSRRYEKLKRSGMIKVSIQVDPTKIGYRASAWFYVAFLSQSSLSTIVETLANIPDVNLIIKTSGVYDVLVEAMIKDIDQLIAIQNEIARIESVAKMETHVISPKPVLPLPREYISTF